MRFKKSMAGFIAFAGITVLIFDAKAAIIGAREGLDLCLQTVVPSLFPFFIFTNLLTTTVMGHPIPALKWLGRLCGIPSGAESLLLIGMLGGYPVGAQCISQSYHSRQLCKEDAHRLLGFCSNAGPSFIFGILGTAFSMHISIWLLWLIHIASALVTGILLPGKNHQSSCSVSRQEPSLPAALRNSVAAIAIVCGWIILFKTILSFFAKWFLWLLPNLAQVIFTGVLELTNGCCLLPSVPNEAVRFVICSAFLSLGGACVSMQTVSVTGSLGTGLYFPGKIFQTFLSILLAIPTASVLYPDQRELILQLLPFSAAAVVPFVLLFLRKKGKIAVAFPGFLVYNKKKC